MFDEPLVAVQGAPIDSPALVAAIVQSIFRQPFIAPGIQRDLYDEVLESFDGRSYGDYPSISDRLHASLVRRLSTAAGETRGDILNALSMVFAHRGETAVVGSAYSATVKARPAGVFWPDPTAPAAQARSIYDELPYVKPTPFIDRTTPIGSAGSCFAMEIAKHLKSEAYNYVVTEDNKFGCANWGIIFNTPSLRQLVERAFGVRRLPKLLWSLPGPTGIRYLDPFREDVIFPSVETYEADLEKHVAAAREALLRVKVFVVTLGMNEVWKLRADGSAISRAPWALASYMVDRHILTPEDNVTELQRMFDIWRSHNPDLKLIVTVSPVPLHATFRADSAHVVVANAHSKSVLRVAAEAFCARNPNAFYFPSFETVLHCTRNPWADDQRHVSAEAVSNVMRLFKAMFVVDDGRDHGGAAASP